MPKRKLHISYEMKRQLKGYWFVLPWILGFILFFLAPMIQSFMFSFESITMADAGGLDRKFTGWFNINYLINTDPSFKTDVVNSVLELVKNVPVIIFFSLFMAMILNEKFIGRGVARVFFFLPLIVTAGVTVEIMQSQIFLSSANVVEATMFKSTALQEVLIDSGIPYNIVYSVTSFVDSIFSLTWRSGVQILLFLSGLQAIPKMYYEASSVEGASPWDAFWKITWPMISPIIFLNVIYTIIDTFTDTANPVLRGVYNSALKDLQYGLSSAQAWIYFLVILLVVTAVYLFLGRRTVYTVE